MLLTCDVGNTSIKLVVYKGNERVAYYRLYNDIHLDFEEEIFDFLNKENIMIEDIEESKAGFENLREEMNEIIAELKDERDQYRFLISQMIQIKNEMLSGVKMSLIEKAKYKFKNK